MNKLSAMLLAMLAFLSACGGGGADRGDPVSALLIKAGPEQTPSVTLPSLSPGFNVEVYSDVNEPMKLSFGADGALYAGRQGGNDRIHRIAPGGGSGSEFGPPMVDPDAVLVDTAGLISGIPNSVLVGGSGAEAGVLAAIFPDQTATVIFNSGFDDVDDMKFDHAGRLVFSDDLSQVLVSNGSAPAVLFSTPSRPGSISIDDDNRIFVALSDGTIRIHNADGSLADASFATGLAGFNTYLAFAPGPGGFGKGLYVLNGSDLLVFNMHGKVTMIGSGFSVGPPSGTGFVFGPDNALYVSEHSRNRILRISRGGGR